MDTGYHVRSQVLDSWCIAIIPSCGILVGVHYRPWHILYTQRTQVMLVQQRTKIAALSSFATPPLPCRFRVILNLTLPTSHQQNGKNNALNQVIIFSPLFTITQDYNKVPSLLLGREIQGLNQGLMGRENLLGRARDRDRRAHREGDGTKRLDATATSVEVVRVRFTIVETRRRCAVHRSGCLCQVRDRLDGRAGVLHTAGQARVSREGRGRLRETDRQRNRNRNDLTSLK